MKKYNELVAEATSFIEEANAYEGKQSKASSARLRKHANTMKGLVTEAKKELMEEDKKK